MFRFAGFHITLFEQEIHISSLIIFAVGVIAVILMLYRKYRMSRAHSATIKYSDLNIVKRVARTGRQRFRFLLTLFRILAVALFVIAFARPQAGTENREVSAEGVDIMMALDISSSMRGMDFKPEGVEIKNRNDILRYSRLGIAKEEIKKFVEKRTSDRIGLVVFSKSSFTQCPLTLDYGVLETFLNQVKFGMIEDGTAIGMALANSINRLRDTPSKSKVIILLTDGINNAGQIDPLTAASIAKTMGIRIYTIGAGVPGAAMYPVEDPIFGIRFVAARNEIDEETLRDIAAKTDGQYFRARSRQELEEIYTEIDKLEKTEIKVSEYVQYKELFPNFVYAGLLLLLLEILLGHTVFRKIP